MTSSKMLLMLCAVAIARIAVADEGLLGPPDGSMPPPPIPSQSPAPAQSPPGLAQLHAACDGDIQHLCAGVKPGGGRIMACLKQHKEAVSGGCKQAISKAMQGPAPGAS